MYNPAPSVKRITYNAIDQRFEAIVVVHDQGHIVKYPCNLPFPINARIEDVKRGLIAAAEARRSSNVLSMVSRRPMKPTPRRSTIAKFTQRIAESLGLADTRYTA